MAQVALDELIDTANDIYELYSKQSDETAIHLLKDCERNLRKSFIQLKHIIAWSKQEIDLEQMLSQINAGIIRDARYIRARNGLHEYDVTEL